MAAPLLALSQPHAKTETVPGVSDRRQQVGVLLAALEQVVGRDQVVRRARQAAVAVEARTDERLIRQVVAGEPSVVGCVEEALRR